MGIYIQLGKHSNTINPFSQQCQSTVTACWLSMPSFYYVYQQACYRKTLKICSRANEQLIVPSFQQRNLVHKDHQTQTEKNDSSYLTGHIAFIF